MGMQLKMTKPMFAGTSIVCGLILALGITVFAGSAFQEAKTEAALAPIALPSDLQITVRNADLEIQNAQLKRANLDLQMRLLLKVPNEYQFNERTMQYEPPPKPPKKPDARKDENK